MKSAKKAPAAGEGRHRQDRQGGRRRQAPLTSVPYLRLTADRRGFENTFLLHVAAPGEAPRVLYWYRTAPGLRIGRPALDDAAMRMLEAQYPNIDFDWPYILDMGTMTPVEVEAPVPPRRRKPRRAESEEEADAASEPPAALDDELPPQVPARDCP